MPTDPLTKQFQYLRKGRGLTIEKLARCPAVLSLLGTSDAASAYQALTTELRLMGESDSVRALRHVLGIEGKPAALLKDRRRRFATSVHRTPDAVELWENQALTELQLRVLEAEQGDVLFLIQRADVRSTVRRRLIDREDFRIEIVALTDGVDSFSYWTSPGSTVKRSSGEAWELVRQTDLGDEYLIHFAHSVPMAARYNFVFSEIKDPDLVPDTEGFTSWSFSTPAIAYDVRVRFGDELPATVWRFENEPFAFQPGTPTDDTILVPDASRSVRATFSNVYGGHQYGIGWLW